jgi:hypothetical protein
MTSTLHQTGSRSTRSSNRPRPASFATAPRATHPHPKAALPPELPTTPGNSAAPELATDLPLAIPELWSFDQDELNDNPVFDELCPIPLIGALLLDRHLITRAQLDTCLLLQTHTYPDLPIGQILLHKQYISQAALDHVLGIQAEIRSALNEIISRVEPQSFK